MLSEEFKERLKAANPIEEVMGAYVTLKRMGRDYICLCPFHNEKTPSCHVRPDQEYFHCFGCGAGGDVVTFVMRYMNLEYIDAIKWLADRAGLEMPEDSDYKKKTGLSRERAIQMNKDAARFFFDKLRSPEGKVCLDYLVNKRGLTIDTIKKYGMGYAPNSWNELKNHMMSLGYKENELEQMSLISRSQHNTKNTFDFFVNRAMFPFIDLTGNIVGFGGRDLSDKDKRKYLNSKENLLYKKNKFLFSLNFAKNSAARDKTLLLCEGNLDVISLNQAGFEGAVASCGTSLTPQQVKSISNYADRVVICYDSDGAGQKATSRAIALFNEVGIQADVIHMEGAKDPDEYVRKFGADHFRALINHSQGGIMYEVKKCREGLDIDTPEGNSEYVMKACRVIADLPYPAQRGVYINELAKETGVNGELIGQQVNAVINKRKKAFEKKDWQRTVTFTNTPRDKINPEANAHPRETAAEKGLIYYIFRNPDRNKDVLEKISPDDFVTELNRRIFRSLTEKISNNLDYSISSFNDEFSPEEMGKITEIVENYSNITVDYDTAQDYIKVLVDYKNKDEKMDFSSASDEDFINAIERIRREKNK